MKKHTERAAFLSSAMTYDRLRARFETLSKRIDPSWIVIDSIENANHDRCVDLFRRPDGSFGFEEFRRDVEDAGAWTPVQYYSHAVYASKDAARHAAARSVVWLHEALDRPKN
jgi:hypothetical protein